MKNPKLTIEELRDAAIIRLFEYGWTVSDLACLFQGTETMDDIEDSIRQHMKHHGV